MLRRAVIVVMLILGLGAGAVVGLVGLDRGWWRPPSLFLSRYPVRGIDVSRHRGDIDWPLVAAQPGLKFAYIKATEGGDWVDSRFLDNWKEAKQAGLKVGAYHFFTFCRAPMEQARHFLSVIPHERDALPPAVDVEFGGNCRTPPPPEMVREDLKIFLDAVEAETGRPPIIYVTGEAYEAIIQGAGFKHALWIRSLYWEPRLQGWLFWQYDARGEVPGIRGPVDLNAFRGPSESLDQL